MRKRNQSKKIKKPLRKRATITLKRKKPATKPKTSKKRQSIRKSGFRQFQNEPQAYTTVTTYKIRGPRSSYPKAFRNQKRFKNFQYANVVVKFKDAEENWQYRSLISDSLEENRLNEFISFLKSDYKIMASEILIEKVMIYKSITGVLKHEKTKRKSRRSRPIKTKTKRKARVRARHRNS